MPVMVKGITTPEAAQVALQHGVDGIVVSNYGGLAGAATDSMVLTPCGDRRHGGRQGAGAGRWELPARHGHSQGARLRRAGVLVARPAMWGLAAYGADGVQGIVEMLQTELARYMAMCGRSHLKMLDRTMLRLHRVPPVRTPATGSRLKSAIVRWMEPSVGRVEAQWRQSVSRREAIAGLAGMFAGSRADWRRRRIRVR